MRQTSHPHRLHTGLGALAIAATLLVAQPLGACPAPAWAEEDGAAAPLEEPVQEPDPNVPPLQEAKAAAVIDQGGNVLYALNAEEELPLASITKVMTAMVALDSGHALDEVVTLQEHEFKAWSQLADYGTGDRVSFGELMRVMLVYSGNDAAYNVAVFVAGSEEAFVDLMNDKVDKMGLTHTHFMNSHGLDEEGQYSTAIELALMGRHAMEHYPFIAQCVCQPYVTTTVRGEQVVLAAHNKLIGAYDGFRGIKSGAIADGYTFMGASGRGGVQLYSAVLGCGTSDGRFDETARLMDWAYARFEEARLTRKDWAVRMQPYAFDLGLKAVVSASDDTSGSMWPGGEGASWHSATPRANRLLEAGEPYGWTDWSQSGRPMGTSFLSSRPKPASASAWPVFSLPLFEDTTSLGR